MAAPGVVVTNPTPGAELTGVETLTATITNTGSGVLGVGWSLDGVFIEFVYSPPTDPRVPPYSHVLDTTTLADGPHSVTVTAQDGSDPGQQTVVTVEFTVNNLHPTPKVVINAPDDGAKLTGTVTVSWTPTARGPSPIWFTSVHVDDPNAAPIEVVYNAPFSFQLDTRTLSDGAHTLYIQAETTDNTIGLPDIVHFESRNPPAHPPISRYGQVRTPNDITDAAIRRLKDWQADYVKVIGASKIVNLPPLRAVIPMTDLQRYPENKLPCAIVVVGPTNSTPIKDEHGYYSATYNLIVGVVASASSEQDTRRVVAFYGAACKMALGQRRKLAEDVVVESWTGESIDPLQVSEKRRLLVCTNSFNVRLDNVFSWKEGPGPDAVPPVPVDPPLPEWPPAIWTELDLTLVKEPID